MQTLFSAISITGSDALIFLQGQLTQDVNNLTQSKSALPSAYCSSQGKVLALGFLAYIKSDSYRYILPADTAEQTLKRLQLFSLHKDVKLSIEKEKISFSQEPFSDESIRLYDNCYVQFSEQSTALDDNALLNIISQHMFPYIKSTLVDQFIPQMLNIELINGISRQKGCYVGQEVIARAWHKGSVRRHAKILVNTTENDIPLSENETLFADNKVAASVIQTFQFEGKNAVLAVVQDRYEASLLSDEARQLQFKIIKEAS